MIIYEAPHHLCKTLKQLYETLGNRNITLCKELTKRYENAFVTTLEDAIAFYDSNEPKGEYVLVIEGKSRADIEAEKRDSFSAMTIEEHMDLYLSKGMEKKEAMKQVAKDRGVPKREIYQALL